MSCRRDLSPPPQRPPRPQTWGWHLGGLLDKLTLNTGADGDEVSVGQKRRRDEEELAELLRDAELLLSIAATAPLDDLSTMIVRLLAVDLEELQPTRRERVRQLVARLQAAKQGRDAAATQLEEDDLTSVHRPADRSSVQLTRAVCDVSWSDKASGTAIILFSRCLIHTINS